MQLYTVVASGQWLVGKYRSLVTRVYRLYIATRYITPGHYTGHRQYNSDEYPQLYQILNNFQNSFTGILSSSHAIKWS